MRTTTIAVLTIVLLGSRLPAAGTIPAAGKAHIEHCQVFLIDEIEVPAHETGPLVSLAVRQGELVHAGQLLARIDDRQPRLQKYAAEVERDAALARAADDIEVRYAMASLEVAEAELIMNEEINRRSPGSVPASEIRRLRLTKHRAELQIDRSRLDLKVARLTADVQQAAVKSAEDSIERRRIVAPHDGMVIDVYREAGEWVDAGEAVLRVVRMDRLRVDGFLNAGQFNPEEIAGRPVTITVQRARGRQVQFPGKVVFVSPMLQAGNKYRVRAEVENRLEDGHWLLGAGMSAAMTVHLRTGDE